MLDGMKTDGGEGIDSVTIRFAGRSVEWRNYFSQTHMRSAAFQARRALAIEQDPFPAGPVLRKLPPAAIWQRSFATEWVQRLRRRNDKCRERREEALPSPRSWLLCAVDRL